MKELNMRRPTQCVNYIEKLVSGLEEELDVSKQCQLLQLYTMASRLPWWGFR